MNGKRRSWMPSAIAAIALLLTCGPPLFAGAASEPCTPDFTLKVVPDKAVATIGYELYTQYRATVTAQCGFGGMISFDVLGVPAKVGAHFDYPSLTLDSSVTTGTTTLLVGAEYGALLGLHPLTITANSGAFVHTQTLDLIVDYFTISATPPTQTVQRRKSASYTITVHPEGGFVGNLYFQVHGLPKNTTATFDPQTVITKDSTVTTLTVTTKGNTPVGAYTLVVSPYLWNQQAIAVLTVQ